MENSKNFNEKLQERRDYAEQAIRTYLPEEEGFAARLIQAMNYSMTAGGKRLRPILMCEAYRMFGGEGKEIEPFMAAMEMIHTHSLIHDDLPAIDNDEYRRGRKTTHAVYGEALGILSGDALLNYAYETALQAFFLTEKAENVRTALQILARKTGIRGMLGGQSVDVMNDGKELSPELLDYIYVHKTSALLEGAMMAGAALAGAGERELGVMESAARSAGLAFQIRDDILDVTSTMEELGKPVHSDEKNHKVTYVTLKGIDGAGREVDRLTGEAMESLRSLPVRSEFLEEILLWMASRKY